MRRRGSCSVGCLLAGLLLALSLRCEAQAQSAARAAGSTAGAPAQGPPAQGPASPGAAFLRANGAELFGQLLAAAGVSAADVFAPGTSWVAFLPSDRAVSAFLASMGLSLAGLQARPQLAKAVVAQHLRLGTPAAAQAALAAGGVGRVQTLAPGRGGLVTVARSAPGQMSVTDAQGSAASVAKVVRPDAAKTALLVDRVLFGGAYFRNIEALCDSPLLARNISLFCNVIQNTGIYAEMKDPAISRTIFLPGNRAFSAAAGTLKGSDGARLTALLRYHMLDGMRELPQGFRSGQSVATMLPGQSLGISYARAPGTTSDGRPVTAASVIPADGSRVPVVQPNVFVGASVAHGTPAVLLPEASVLPATQELPTTAVYSEPTGPVTASEPPLGRRLQQAEAWDLGASVAYASLSAAEARVQAQLEGAVSSSRGRW